MFKQAKQNRAFEDVIFQIQEAILQRSLKVGDKLPSERQLRETFKVSRGTLREALRALEQKGLITIKTGVQGGAFICPVNNKMMSESLDLLLRQQKITLKELAEFREAVEGCVAAKAARKAKKADIKQLNNLLESIKNHLDASPFDWKAVILKDSEFHLSLSRIAGNRVFESILGTIYENIFKYFDLFLSKKRRLQEKNYRDLCKITEAIRKRDPQKAQDHVQEHVRYFNRMMKKGEQAAKTIGSRCCIRGRCFLQYQSLPGIPRSRFASQRGKPGTTPH
jgi:DNA-binding FadR family transcriptional regulator